MDSGCSTFFSKNIKILCLSSNYKEACHDSMVDASFSHQCVLLWGINSSCFSPDIGSIVTISHPIYNLESNVLFAYKLSFVGLAAPSRSHKGTQSLRISASRAPERIRKADGLFVENFINSFVGLICLHQLLIMLEVFIYYRACFT